MYGAAAELGRAVREARRAAEGVRRRADRPAARSGDEAGREVDARSPRRLRGSRRDLPADGVHPDRVPRPRLPRRPPPRRRRPQAPPRLLHPRGRHDPHPALPLARLGHRPRAARARRGRPRARLRPRPPRHAVAAQQGMPRRRRLAAERREGRRAVGLVLRVREPPLPRHRRHRDGPRRAETPGRQGRFSGPVRGVELAPRHAERRRRLGRVRPHEGPPDPREDPLRRPQRDAGPELPGHHRPHPRSARPQRLLQARTTRCTARSRYIKTPAGRRAAPGGAAGA